MKKFWLFNIINCFIATGVAASEWSISMDMSYKPEFTINLSLAYEPNALTLPQQLTRIDNLGVAAYSVGAVGHKAFSRNPIINNIFAEKPVGYATRVASNIITASYVQGKLEENEFSDKAALNSNMVMVLGSFIPRTVPLKLVQQIYQHPKKKGSDNHEEQDISNIMSYKWPVIIDSTISSLVEAKAVSLYVTLLKKAGWDGELNTNVKSAAIVLGQLAFVQGTNLLINSALKKAIE